MTELQFVGAVIAIVGVLKSLFPNIVSSYVTILVAGVLGGAIGFLGLVPTVTGVAAGVLWGLAASGAVTVAEKVAGTK